MGAPQRYEVSCKDLWTLIDTIDHVDMMRVGLGNYSCRLAKARSQISSLQIARNDGGAICFNECLRIGFARSKLETSRRKFGFRKCVGPLDLQRVHNIPRSLLHLKGNLDIASAVVDGRGD